MVRNVFQVSAIRVSYRIRGYDPRTHKKAYAIVIVLQISEIPRDLLNPLKKRQDVSILMNRILPYSAMNRRANSPPPYSMLKPDTSSDSPSAKSKGARLVSARAVTIHISIIIGTVTMNQKGVCLLKISSVLNLSDISRMDIRTSAILIS